MALLLAGLIGMGLYAAPADATSPAPSKVEVHGTTMSWNITVDYTDGSMRTVMAGATSMGDSSFEIAVSAFDAESGPRVDYINQQMGEPADMPAGIAPGVVIGVYRPDDIVNGQVYSYIVGRMYSTSTYCDGQSCITAGLKEKPQTQAATVAAVPTTGAPSSDLVLPAALLAAGMVGGGLMIRKKKDRGRA